jgi:hypothetical protein
MSEIKYEYDAIGNIIQATLGDKVVTEDQLNVPEYNKVTNEDDMAVSKAKRKKQVELFEAALNA